MPVNLSMRLLTPLLLTIGCPTYSDKVKESLMLDYVYIPPNNSNLPYTLLQFTKTGNFQAVCQATTVTGYSESKLKKMIKYSDAGSLFLKVSDTIDFDIKLSPKEIAELGVANDAFDGITLSFTNGKIISLPSMELDMAYKNIKTSGCAKSAKSLLEEVPDSIFVLPREIYSYTVNFSVHKGSRADVTASFATKLKNFVLSKVSMSQTLVGSYAITGENIFVGFRGTPVTIGLYEILEQKNVIKNHEKFRGQLANAPTETLLALYQGGPAMSDNSESTESEKLLARISVDQLLTSYKNKYPDHPGIETLQLSGLDTTKMSLIDLYSTYEPEGKRISGEFETGKAIMTPKVLTVGEVLKAYELDNSKDSYKKLSKSLDENFSSIQINDLLKQHIASKAITGPNDSDRKQTVDEMASKSPAKLSNLYEHKINEILDPSPIILKSKISKVIKDHPAKQLNDNLIGRFSVPKGKFDPDYPMILKRTLPESVPKSKNYKKILSEPPLDMTSFITSLTE